MAGVAIGWWWSPLSHGLVAGLVVAIWATAVIGGWWGRTAVVTVAVLAGCVVAGALIGSLATERATVTSLGDWLATKRPDRGGYGPVAIEGILNADGVSVPDGARLTLSTTRVRTPRGWRAIRGGVRLSVWGQFAGQMAREWTRGRRLRVYATLRPAARYLNPGVPDQRRRLLLRGTVALGSVKSALLVEVIEPGGIGAEMAAAARRTVRQRVGETVGRFSARSAGIVTAVLVGERAGLTAEDRRRLQEGGTYHVVAISGGNVAMLSALLMLVGRVATGGRRLSHLLTVTGLIAYALIVGGEPSVARATLAASIFLMARAYDRPPTSVNTLALTAACLVVVAPLSILEAGFWLTFLATLGIVAGVPPLLDRVARSLTLVGAGIAWRVAYAASAVFLASLCAELALLPVAAALFSRVTVAGLLLNFAAVPLMAVVQVAGLVALAGSLASDTVALMAAWVAHLAASGLVESARLVDVWPRLSWRVAPPAHVVTVAYYVGWIIWAVPGRRIGLRVLGGCIVGASALVIGTGGLPSGPLRCGNLVRPLRVVFLDVDQADATLVRTPSGHSLLVDAAGGRGRQDTVGERVVAPAVWAEGLRRLDYVAVSHGHPDHVGGAPAILRDFAPREVWAGIPVPSSTALTQLKDQAAGQGTAWRSLQAGDTVSLGAVTVEVEHPPLPQWERPAVRNDDSLVLDVRYGAVSVILPGDIGADVERTLLDRIPSAPIRVLKVPHHGSRTSSSTPFVRALRPDAVVVSAGRFNPFGHPHEGVVRRYRDAGAQVFSTGLDGAVTLCTDGRVGLLETAGGTQSMVLPRVRSGV